jgi:hypothetical protein
MSLPYLTVLCTRASQTMQRHNERSTSQRKVRHNMGKNLNCLDLPWLQRTLHGNTAYFTIAVLDFNATLIKQCFPTCAVFVYQYAYNKCDGSVL